MSQLTLFSALNEVQPLPLQIAHTHGFALQYHTQTDDTIVYAVQDWIAGVAQSTDMQRAKNIFQMIQRRLKSTSVMMTLVKQPYKSTNGQERLDRVRGKR